MLTEADDVEPFRLSVAVFVLKLVANIAALAELPVTIFRDCSNFVFVRSIKNRQEMKLFVCVALFYVSLAVSNLPTSDGVGAGGIYPTQNAKHLNVDGEGYVLGDSKPTTKVTTSRDPISSTAYMK